MLFQHLLLASSMALLSGSATAELENRNSNPLGNPAGGLVPGMHSPSPTPTSGFKRVAAPTAAKRDFLNPLQQENDETSNAVFQRDPDLLGGLVPGLSQSSAASSSPTPSPSPTPSTPYNPILKRVAPTPPPGNAPKYHLPGQRAPLNLARRDSLDDDVLKGLSGGAA